MAPLGLSGKAPSFRHSGKTHTLLLALAAALFWVGVFPAWGLGSRGLQVGDVLTVRTVVSVDGQALELPSGSRLNVIVFWATWSPRSAPALKLWQQMAVDYSAQDMKVVAVNADHQDLGQAEMDAITGFVHENGIKLPIVLDRGLKLFNEIGVIVVPTAVLINSEGKITDWMGSLPTSAALDYREKLDRVFGLSREPAEKEEVRVEVKQVYKPENRAGLYYNLAKQLQKKGFRMKARARFITALQKDPNYPAPVAALEKDFFKDGETPEAVEGLRQLLLKGGLEDLAAGYISEEEPETKAASGAGVEKKSEEVSGGSHGDSGN